MLSWNRMLVVTILVFTSTLISVLSLVFIIKAKPDTKVSDSITQNLMGFASTFTKSTTEIKHEITEKLHENFSFVGKELREELSKTTKDLEAKFTGLENKVNSRLETIGKDVQTKLDKNIQDGFSHFQKVQETLAGAEKQLAGLNAVGQSIQELNNVLNLPHLRGKLIGEGSLDRLLSDFLPTGFFESQYSIEGNLVDFVIKFPHLNLVLPIDSKFSMEQVSGLYDHTNIGDDLKNARKRLSEITRQNAKDIKNKYIKPKAGTTDYALMYLPSETLYFEVIRDHELWSAMAALKVFPVSPNTLAITVNSIGKALQYYEMARGVQTTLQQLALAKDHLDDFKKRFDDIGEKLFKAQDSFQKANTHLGHYTSSVQRLAEPDATLKLKNDTGIA